MPNIYSTLSTDMLYSALSPGAVGSNIAVRERGVQIKGGANVANKYVMTPKGVRTEVTDEELALLEKDEVFKLHKKNGFITIEKDKKRNADTVAADMNPKDGSAPKTPAELEKEAAEARKKAEAKG
jgi:hypothetical protein